LDGLIDMHPETAVIVGLFVALLALPSWLSARVDARRPVLALTLALAGGGLAWWGAGRLPGGLQPAELPDMLFRVIGRLLN